MMPVSLCALRLEIAEGHDAIEFESYPDPVACMASGSSVMAECGGKSDRSAPNSYQDRHDRRTMRKITVETYTPGGGQKSQRRRGRRRTEDDRQENQQQMGGDKGQSEVSAPCETITPPGGQSDSQSSLEALTTPAVGVDDADGNVGSNGANSSGPSQDPGMDSAGATSELDTDVKAFVAGNPFVESTEGLMHLYKENVMTSLEPGVPRSQLVCMLSVPAKLAVPDLLSFTASCFPDIERMRIVRDNTPNQYMVLIKFRTQEAADSFYSGFNGVRYNSLDPEVCRLVFVARVDVLNEADSAKCAVQGYTELPTCPVCLERMDESVDGVLTVLCSHSFHATCIGQWGDTSCPVCRHVQIPDQDVESMCLECEAQRDLWICLICGHVGCGRYLGGHASSHFLETGHTFAMQVGRNRVWDYVGDNFVHRLVQNKEDGKMVEVPSDSRSKQEEFGDKLEGVELEYTYLLTSQLQSQREYYERLLSEQRLQAEKCAGELEERSVMATEDCRCLKEQLTAVTRDKHSSDKKVQYLSQRLSRCLRELQDEQEMNSSLCENQKQWQDKVDGLQTQLAEHRLKTDEVVRDLREQVRDLMFAVEAQQKICDSSAEVREEIASGNIVVPEASPKVRQPASSRKKRR